MSWTTTGSFLCLYAAVVPVCNVDKLIFGTLVFVKSFPFSCVIYLRNAKSNSSGFASYSVGIVVVVLATSTIGCSAANLIASVVSVPFKNNVFLVDVCVISIFTFTFSISVLGTVI